MAIEVKLIRSWAGSPKRHRDTLDGLGLYKMNDARVLPDTAAVLGMIARVGHLVTYQRTAKEFKPFGRRPQQAARHRKKQSQKRAS